MLRTLTLAVVVAVLAVTAGRATKSWPRDAHLGYAEGIWLGLAVDASHGVLYRPLEGPDGIGGSRYFPLFYLAIAAGIAAGIAPITAGYVVATLSVGLLVAGIFLFLRRLGADVILASLAAVVVLACQPTQMAVLATRGDALAAGLALFGLAFSVAGSRGWVAPVFFALAFATKPTSLYAPAAAIVTLALNDRRAEARTLALRTLAGIALLVGVFLLASGGRMLTVLMASSSGGTGWATILAAPYSAARILRRVPESALLVFSAGVVVISAWLASRWRPSIERAAFILCGLATLAIYASPATIENHLIDLTALSTVVLGALAVEKPRWFRHVTLLLLAVGLTAGGFALMRSRDRDVIDNRSVRSDVLAALAGTREPIFFDQPMLDAQRRTRPWVIDQYVYSIRMTRDASAIDGLIADIERKKFGAMVFDVLTVDLAIAEAYPPAAAARFTSALDRAYRLDQIVAGKPIYKPR